MFRIRWASHHDFQRTRGVLRILATIVSDLWKRQGSLTGTNTLIHTSDVNIDNLDALREQLKKLYGNGYEAVMAADVAGSSSNAFKIDTDKREFGNYSITQGTAGTILLGSFGGTGANKGISLEELKLCLMKPNTFNHNLVNGALDALEICAHYLYYTTTGTRSKRYWYYTKPNLNILVNQTKNEIPTDTIYANILQKLSDISHQIEVFNVLVNPSEDIPEQKKPTLIILGPQQAANPEEVNIKLKPLIEKLATKKGNSERIYRNTILFLICSEIGLVKLCDHMREYLAGKKIKEEYKSQLEPDQQEEIKRKIEEALKEVDSSLVSAYTIAAKYIAKKGIDILVLKQFKERLSQQINETLYNRLNDEYWLLDGVGYNTLKINNLIPTKDHPIRMKDLYEAFIRYDDKPMITGITPVQKSIENYYKQEQFAIAVGEPPEFTKIYFKEPIPFFEVTDTNYWIVEKSLKQPKIEEPGPGPGPGSYPPPPPPPPPPPQKVNKYKTINISGKVELPDYSHIFTGLILPLQSNRVEIEIKIKGTGTQANPLTENSQSYKVVKETAHQLGLKFEAEEEKD